MASHSGGRGDAGGLGVRSPRPERTTTHRRDHLPRTGQGRPENGVPSFLTCVRGGKTFTTASKPRASSMRWFGHWRRASIPAGLSTCGWRVPGSFSTRPPRRPRAPRVASLLEARREAIMIEARESPVLRPAQASCSTRANAGRPVQRTTQASTCGAGPRSRPPSGADEITDATFRSATVNESPRRYADRKSTRLNSSHGYISYAVFCLKKKKKNKDNRASPTHYKTI